MPNCWVCGEEHSVLGPHIAAHPDEKVRAALKRHIREMESELGRPPTGDEMRASTGRPSSTPYRKRFGTWNDAVRAAGYEPENEAVTIPSDEELIDEIKRLGACKGRPPTQREMWKEGQYSARVYRLRFSTWNAAVERAGFEIPNNRRYNIPDAELISHLEDVTAELGRPPTFSEIESMDGFGSAVYARRFGSWRSALEIAGFEVGEDRPETVPSGPDHPNWRGGPEFDYGEGWNQQKRQAVRERDGFACQRCGMEEDEHRSEYGMALHVHHIEPAREIDDASERNAMANLTTLCLPCHAVVELAPVAGE